MIDANQCLCPVSFRFGLCSFVLSCLVLSCVVLSCVVLSCFMLFCFTSHGSRAKVPIKSTDERWASSGSGIVRTHHICRTRHDRLAVEVRSAKQSSDAASRQQRSSRRGGVRRPLLGLRLHLVVALGFFLLFKFLVFSI